MKHRVHHDLDPQTARKAADKALEAYSEKFAQFNPQATWKNDSHADVTFNVKGKTLKGTVDLEPNAIALDLDVPFVFRVFKGQAMKVIEGEVQTWVNKAKAGEI